MPGAGTTVGKGAVAMGEEKKEGEGTDGVESESRVVVRGKEKVKEKRGNNKKIL